MNPEANQPQPVVRLRQVHRQFKVGFETVNALDGVDLDIHRGEFFGITGPSGSGKSTMLYLVGGMDRPTGGRIEVTGQDISQMDENQLATFRRTMVGFVYQSFHLIPTMTALENVEFPMIFSQVPRKDRRERAAELLEKIGLGNRMQHKPTEMSGGQRQRVAIARALTNHPEVLLADEPTGNLDSRSGAEVVDLLHELIKTQGVTVLIVSHDPAVIASTTRHIQLQDGQIQHSES
ncbi:MAG: ABC transporter ATP-binding protein [Chloroflexi bacterium]|nr:ABC transporter ATP-binding protein [Chloroflexota bacterium]